MQYNQTFYIQTFLPETTDIYDKKNMPRAVFCIHALSLFMFKMGSAPQIQDLCGRLEFTRDEINCMEAELSRAGVEMPQFRQLGGILADQGGGNRKKISKAVEDIVRSVTSKDMERLLASLTRPEAGLEDVRREYVKEYMMVLECNVSRAGLSQAEVQGHITRVNLLMCLEQVAEAVRRDDVVALRAALRDNILGLARLVREENMELYLTHLVDCVEDLVEGEVLKRDVITEAVEAANLLGRERQQLEEAMEQLNLSLRQGDSGQTWRSLHHPALRLAGLETAGQELYHSELRYIQTETGADLTYEGVCLPVQFLSLVAGVSVAGRAGEAETVWRLLSSPHLALQDLDSGAGARYSQEIINMMRLRSAVLTHGELQLVVDRVNENLDRDLVRLEAVEAVNAALLKARGVVQALRHPALSLESSKIVEADEVRYLQELQARLANKSVVEGEGVGLWYEDILAAVEEVMEDLREIQTFVGVLRGVNSAVENGDKIGVYNYLSNNSSRLGLSNITRSSAQLYLTALQERARLRNGGHSWLTARLAGGTEVWLELEGGRHSWLPPNIQGIPSGVLDIEDIRAAVGAHSDQFNTSVVNFQARARGYVVRKKLFQMLDWYYKRENQVVTVQALWRGRRVRRLLERKESKAAQLTEARRLRLEAARLRELGRYEREVVVIQRAWRDHRARQSWARMLRGGAVSLDTVVSHLHLLDIRDMDFREELDLQTVRGELSKLIRQNESLEGDLDKMDVKIGLLVQNRISLQDSIKTTAGFAATLKRDRREGQSSSELSVGTHRGLKALKKESHDKLKAYQHLFYLLQTNPNYLARLMFALPQSKTNKFLESVILTLYNFGGNAREEYLLLKLFKTALIEEVSTRFDKINDVVAGNPLVVKLVISYNRTGRGGYGLKELLGPLIKQVLDDTKLKINTNPVEVYKCWINQLESETGQACGLPYDVTQEVALGYEEVQKRLAKSITDLKRMVTLFLTTIIKGLDKFPYGILYISKILFNVLKEKFPESQDKDLLKVIGNLVYYRYVNPTIIAPERFDMVDKKCDQNLNHDQRRNLGSIAKILQFAASKKGFGDESEHLMCLNPFIIECHEKFKMFFSQCISVPEPEDQFNIDQYTEAVLMAKPTIYISLSELCDSHQLVLDHREVVAPLSSDPLHSILNTLGPPSLCSLLGAANSPGDTCLTSLGKTEVCLTLTSQAGQQGGQATTSDTDKLWLKTKHLLLAILPAVQVEETCRNLIGALKSRTNSVQERTYCQILDKRDIAGDTAAVQNDRLDLTNVFCDDEGRLPLEDAKRLVLKNLRILEVRHFLRVCLLMY